MLELRIAKPCDQAWAEMAGDERTRHCAVCRKSVFNVAEMSEAEVEALIRRTEGRFCARVYRRADGTVMTRDCPKGVAGVRRRVALALTTVCAALLYGAAFAAVGRREPKTFAQIKEQARTVEPVRRVLDLIDPPAPVTVLAGAVAVCPPRKTHAGP